MEEQNNEEDQEDSGFDDLGEDFIVGGIQKVRKDNEMLADLKESFNLTNRQAEGTQVNLDHKPFLDFILANNEFDREELLQLKKKIAGIQSKETKRNLTFLREREGQLQEIVFKEKEKAPNTS